MWQKFLCWFACVLFAVSGVGAKDIRGRWFAGGTLAYHTTQDTVENNASMEGDPRPDDYAARELTLEETVQFGVHLGYGLTSNLTLQLDVGWNQSEAGSIDEYFITRYPTNSSILTPYVLDKTVNSSTSHPFAAGTLTQVPVGLTGTMHFRKDTSLKPFLGAGVGVIFLEFDPADELYELNQRLEKLHTYSITDERGREVMPEFWKNRFYEFGGQMLFYGLTFGTDTTFEWHLSAGLEYAIQDRLALVTEVRYTAAATPLRLNLKGRTVFRGPAGKVVFESGPEDQITYHFYPEELFRPDGTLLIYNDTKHAPNPINPRAANLGERYGCTALVFGLPVGGPGQAVDINGDGQIDKCYQDDPTPEDDPFGELLIQGGEIDLSGFNIQLGLRWYF